MSSVYKSFKCQCGANLSLRDFERDEEFACPSCQQKHSVPGDCAITQDDSSGKTCILVEKSPPPQKSTSFLKPGDFIGAYKITAKLGKGGMGVVYKAYEESLERDIAIKVISSELAAEKEFIERFKREAKSAAALNHPNIISIYAISEEKNKHFFTMEFVDGRSLEAMLEEKGRIPLGEALDYIIQTAKGLEAALKKGIIHRDIKPSNLLVAAAGLVKVADFGLAKLIRPDKKLPSLTNNGITVGTPIYMAPEQTKGDEIDHRADIYALGATFYHLVTGKTPFEGDTPLKVALKHITDPLVDPSKLNAGISPAVSQIICRMMEKDRDKRYATYEELIAALEETAKPLAYVSLLPRSVAFIVDMIFCTALWFVLSLVLTGVLYLLKIEMSKADFSAVIFPITYFIYNLKRLRSTGQTYGMRLMHIQARSERGGLPNVYQITARFLLTLFLPGILVSFFNRRHKTLADIITKTAVVFKI
ncbi:MAG: protein kinase [Planctomycetota bacterium]